MHKQVCMMTYRSSFLSTAQGLRHNQLDDNRFSTLKAYTFLILFNDLVDSNVLELTIETSVIKSHRHSEF